MTVEWQNIFFKVEIFKEKPNKIKLLLENQKKMFKWKNSTSHGISIICNLITKNLYTSNEIKTERKQEKTDQSAKWKQCGVSVMQGTPVSRYHVVLIPFLSTTHYWGSMTSLIPTQEFPAAGPRTNDQNKMHVLSAFWRFKSLIGEEFEVSQTRGGRAVQPQKRIIKLRGFSLFY